MLHEELATPRHELPLAADSALPAGHGTDTERLALTLLKLAEKFEVEAGLVVQITPAMPLDALAALAGVDTFDAGILLEYLTQTGVITRRRQRFLLAQPEALYSLALGVPG